MGTAINSIRSYLRAFQPGVTGTPSIPNSGDTDYGPQLEPVFEYLSDTASLTNGQLLIGASGAAALTDPSTGPTLSQGTGGSLTLLGSYDVSYTLTNADGETIPSTPTVITLTGSNNKIIVTAITPLPAGATGANWYVSDGPGSSTLRKHSANSGATFNITATPSTSNDLPPSSNTTASAAHGVKAVPTGTNGIAVTTGVGTLDFAYNPAAANDQNGFYLKRLRIENFATGSLPVLTTGDKGRLAFDTTLGELSVWDGTTWIPLGASTGTSGAAGGDLSLTFPNPKVIKLQGNPVSAASPATGQALVWDGSQWAPAAGASSNATSIRGKNVTTTTPTSGQGLVFNGTSWAPTDIVPTSGNATSVGSIPLSGTPSVGQVLVYNGTNWVPSDIIAVDGNATTIAGYTVDTTTPTSNQAYVFNGSSFVPATVQTSAPPDANATTKGIVQLTADFGGTAASPQVAKLQGVAISGTPATGNVLTATGTTAASWAAPGGGGGAATSIMGLTVNGSSPANGKMLQVSGGNWVPVDPPASPNYAVNGALDIKTRGTSFTFSATSGQTNMKRLAPMWNVHYADDVSSGTADIIDIDGTNGTNLLPASIRSYLKVVATVGGGISAGFSVRYLLENFGKLYGQNFTLSWYAKANTATTFVGYLDTTTTDGSAGTTNQNHSVTTTWQRFSRTITSSDIPDGGVEYIFSFPGGVTGRTLYITGMQVDIGSAPFGYTKTKLSAEAAACGRFYRTSYDPGTSLGSLTFNGAYSWSATKAGATAQKSAASVYFGTPMDATPTILFWNPATSSNAQARNHTQNQDCTSTAAQNVGCNGFNISLTGSAGTAVGDEVAVHWTACCEHTNSGFTEQF